jgi:flavodoxin I
MGKLFYGTQTGTTEGVANTIHGVMRDLIQECRNICRVSPKDFESTDFLILGGSTWGDGELNDDWGDFLPKMNSINLKGKKVALFCLGDQYSYSYNFVSSMKILYDKVIERGGEVIGSGISTEGFEFDHSEAIVDGKFIGLVIDEVNEPDMTIERIKLWEAQIRASLGVIAA